MISTVVDDVVLGVAVVIVVSVALPATPIVCFLFTPKWSHFPHPERSVVCYSWKPVLLFVYPWKTSNLSSFSHTESILEEFANLSPEKRGVYLLFFIQQKFPHLLLFFCSPLHANTFPRYSPNTFIYICVLK